LALHNSGVTNQVIGEIWADAEDLGGLGRSPTHSALPVFLAYIHNEPEWHDQNPFLLPV